MTPLEIEILLHYFTSAIDHPDVFDPPPSQKEAFGRFVANGYLEDNSKCGQIGEGEMVYSATEKLHVYCEALCRVPEPRQEWVN